MKNKDEQFKELKKQQLQNLGERLKKLRISKGYTSDEYFAYDHNLHRAQYGRYEKGEDLKFSSLSKVLKALDISLTDFFEEGF
jgi:transcriptional regulator with XRE-family HTH domain